MKFINFFKHDIWRIRINSLPKIKFLILKHLRILLLTFRGFKEDKCQLRASALTFYSLLSIVPVLAMAFGIAKGFGFEQMLQQYLTKRFAEQQEVVNKLIDFAHSLLVNTKGGIVAGIGVIVLFWTVVKVLTNIEKSFNDIWGVVKARSIGRRLSDYLAIMIICPVFIIASGSATVFLSAKISAVLDSISFLGGFADLAIWSLKILPYFFIWLVFIFIYMFMPNTKVNLRSAILGGILAGTLYQLLQWGYFYFQVGMSKYNAIYGSFAALPLFLVWLQLSWLIVLLGAEIVFAHQNVDTYEFEADCLNVSYNYKQLLSLYVVSIIVKKFIDKQSRKITAKSLQDLTSIPVRLIREVLFELTDSGIIVAVNNDPDANPTYQPALPVSNLRIIDVVNALNSRGSDNVPVKQDRTLEKISESLQQLNQDLQNSNHNKLIKDII